MTAGSIKTLYRATLRSDSNAGGRLSEGFFEIEDHLLLKQDLRAYTVSICVVKVVICHI